MTTAKPLRIWTVVVGEPSPVDGPAVRMLRTGLLSRLLAQRGHDVTWFNGTLEHRGKTQRFSESKIIDGDFGMKMAFLHGRTYNENISCCRIGNHRDVAKSFLKMAASLEKPDVILCSYPPIELADAVAKYATANGIPYVLDLRDMWPDIIADIAPAFLRPLAKLAMAGWYRAAKKAARGAVGLIGISKPFLAWGQKDLAGRAPVVADCVFHLANDPESAKPDDLQKAAAFWDDLGVKGDKCVLMFSGMLSNRYDLKTVVEGAWGLPKDIADKVQIVICGKGEAEGTLKAAACNAPHIVFAGWRNLADIQVLSKRATAGILPYFSSQDFVMAFPNKVGEYLSGGLPIVSCLKGEVAILIDTESCGLTYAEGNAQSFADVVEKIVNGKADMPALSAAASRVYAREFDAAKIYADYADYIESLKRI